MKKLWNSIGVVLLIMFCILTCASHLANKFFQKDIGAIVIGEVNLNQHINALFNQIEVFVPDLDKDAFLNLKAEIEHNTAANRIFGEASKDMLNDIVNNDGQNQDMKEVLRELLYSYDEQLEKVLSGVASKEQINTYIDEGLKYTPIQEVYDISVDSFQKSIPISYMRILTFVNFISQAIFFMVVAGMAIFTTILLVIFNRQHFKWLFPVGMAAMVSGIALFIAGQVVPAVYQKMLQNLDVVFNELSNQDFHIITIYSFSLLLVGIGCLGLHVFEKRKLNKWEK